MAMKITIELSEAEVKGLKAYLKDVNGDGKAITKKDIQTEIQGIVSGNLQVGAVADYINQFENK